VLRASSISGDWRDWGGRLELGAILAVNTPGFPVLRQVVASGRPTALIASGPAPSVSAPELEEVRKLLPALRAAAIREQQNRDREAAELAAHEAAALARRTDARAALHARMRSAHADELRSRMSTLTKETR
jgi:hypothetical protein